MMDIETTTCDSSEAVAEIQFELNESQASVEFMNLNNFAMKTNFHNAYKITLICCLHLHDLHQHGLPVVSKFAIVPYNLINFVPDTPTENVPRAGRAN